MKEKHPNPWGLYDMLGNVWEWCADGSTAGTDSSNPYGRTYAEQRISDPFFAGEGRPGRVVRGGAWGNGAWRVRAAYRSADRRGDWSGRLGFRMARGRALVPGGAGSG